MSVIVRVLGSPDVAARHGLDHGAAPAAERVVLGAFDDDALVRMAGGTRERYAKASHRASVWGMFVVPEQRGRGAGRALLDALIEPVRAWPGLRDPPMGHCSQRIAVAFDPAECHCSGRAFRRLAELHGQPPNAWNDEP